MAKLLLDIGGLDKEPVARGLTLSQEGDRKVLTVADNGMFATIRLTEDEQSLLRQALFGYQVTP